MFDSFRHLRKSLNSFLYRYVPPSGECAWSMKVSVRRISIREGSWKSAAKLANQPQTAAANNCAIRNKMHIKSNDLLRNMITFLGYHTVCAENSGFQLFTARRLYRPRPTYSVVRRYICAFETIFLSVYPSSHWIGYILRCIEMTELIDGRSHSQKINSFTWNRRHWELP